MILTDTIGYIAALLTTIAFIPQALKVIQTKETEGISLWMYIIFSTGVFFWLLYGIFQHVYPIIYANAITLVFALIILIFKIKETKKDQNG